MARADEFVDGATAFAERVEELRIARARSASDTHLLLDAALFELEHVAERLWPAFERLRDRESGACPADGAEQRLLRAFFERLPLPVAVTDRDTVVRRVNRATARLTGVRAAAMTGREFTSLLRPGDRAALRTRTAAVARGEGPRALRVRLGHGPHPAFRATLTALRLPDEPYPAVLLLLQADPQVPGSTVTVSGTLVGDDRSACAMPGPATPLPHPAADLLDATTTALLRSPSRGTTGALAGAAGVLRDRFADWVCADLTVGGALRRTTVLGPPGGRAAVLSKTLMDQDPRHCPVVRDTAGGGATTLLVRSGEDPDRFDPDCFGRAADGVSVLLRARMSSLLCVPLAVPPDAGGRPLGALTLIRTGDRPPFSPSEARTAELVARHMALAVLRPGVPAPAIARSSG